MVGRAASNMVNNHWLWDNKIECSYKTRKLLDKIINRNITLDSHYMDYRNRVFSKNFGIFNPFGRSSLELDI